MSQPAFTQTARRFCQWAESDKHDLATARELLLALLQGVPHLEVQEDPRETDPEYPRRGLEGWKGDHQRIADFPFQFYKQMFAPCDLNETEPVTGDVHDDLCDIYGDLWHGLQALDRGDVLYAVNYWSESYLQHWGHHASAALYAIDEYYREAKFQELLNAPDEDG